MVNIDEEIFAKNLLLTQQYCDQQLKQLDKNLASIFRSINPEYGGKLTFNFCLNKIAGEQEFYCFGTNWTTDPYNDNLGIFEDLFETQLQYKNQSVNDIKIDTEYKGEIIAFKINETLIDGAAEVASHGIIDELNCPPIDSWFYKTPTLDGPLLLAWIPEQFVNYANEGISVNPENCIDWFKAWYPQEYRKLMKIDYTEPSNKVSRLPEWFRLWK